MAKKNPPRAKKPSSTAKEPYNFDRILSEDRKDFCRWFWTGTKGNEVIDALNSNNTESDGSTIRRQHEGQSHIYGIVLNDDATPGKGTNGVQWKYCKVGKTQADTTTGSHNRMETLRDEIERKTGMRAGILFVLEVKATDSRNDIEIEKSVRKKFGWPVHKDLAKELNLPVPTEWVITTQPYIYEFRGRIGANADTGFFADERLQFRESERNLPNYLELVDGKVQKRQ